RHRRPQADAADVVLAKAQPIAEGAKEFCVAGHGEGWFAGRRRATPGEVGDQDPPVTAERRAPAMEVLQRAHEAVTEKQRLARSLVEVPDPPLPDVDELDVLRANRADLTLRYQSGRA